MDKHKTVCKHCGHGGTWNVVNSLDGKGQFDGTCWDGVECNKRLITNLCRSYLDGTAFGCYDGDALAKDILDILTGDDSRDT